MGERELARVPGVSSTSDPRALNPSHSISVMTGVRDAELACWRSQVLGLSSILCGAEPVAYFTYCFCFADKSNIMINLNQTFVVPFDLCWNDQTRLVSTYPVKNASYAAYPFCT